MSNISRDRFFEIMKEYDYTKPEIAAMWMSRPKNINITEAVLRKTAEQQGRPKYIKAKPVKPGTTLSKLMSSFKLIFTRK